MSLEEFLALIRAGKIKISMHYDAFTGKIVCRRAYPSGTSEDIFRESLNVIRDNQCEVFCLVRNNYTRVCYNVIGHKPYHIDAILEDDTEIMICEECTRIRQLDRSTEESLLLCPPIDIYEAVI